MKKIQLKSNIPKIREKHKNNLILPSCVLATFATDTAILFFAASCTFTYP